MENFPYETERGRILVKGIFLPLASRRFPKSKIYLLDPDFIFISNFFPEDIKKIFRKLGKRFVQFFPVGSLTREEKKIPGRYRIGEKYEMRSKEEPYPILEYLHYIRGSSSVVMDVDRFPEEYSKIQGHATIINLPDLIKDYERKAGEKIILEELSQYLPRGVKELAYSYFRERKIKFLRQWGSIGVEDGQFFYPRSIALSGDEVYIGDISDTRLQVFSKDSSGSADSLREWNTHGTQGIAISDNEVYLTDSTYNQVLVFEKGVEYEGRLREWGRSGKENGQFEEPHGIAIFKDQVFVVDSLNARVQVFTKEGKFIRKWGSLGSNDGQFDHPTGIAISGDEVYIVDMDNHRVQVFSLNGRYLRQWGTEGLGDGKFKYPTNIAISEDIMYISDTGNNRIQLFTKEGEFLQVLNSWGKNGYEFSSPAGIAVSDDELYVVNQGSGHIQVFQVE